MIVRIIGSVMLAAAAAMAAQDATALRGAYRFVQFSYAAADGAKLQVASVGGTLSFDGAGALVWGDESGRYEVTGSNEAKLTAGTLELTVRFSPDAGVLMGTSAGGAAGPREQLLVAVRSAEGVPADTLRGSYAVASLAVRNGVAAGLATAFAQLTASGSGQFTRAALTGHAAGIDDVNRREERTGLTYELGSDGTGVAHMGSGSDMLNGDHRIAVSSDGNILLGWSADAAHPAILLGVRKSPDTAVFSFRERYWLGEVLVEDSFAFQQSTRWSTASGSLSSSRSGVAYLAQQIRSGGEVSYLATTNQYRLSSDGSTAALGPKLEAGIDNFAFNEQAFVSGQVGVTGQLTLSHGILFGLAAPPMLPVLSSAAAPLVPHAAMAPGALMMITGSFGAEAAAPDAVTVRINGAAAAVVTPVTADRIRFLTPASLEAGPVTVEVMLNGAVTQTLRAARAASAPVLFTAEETGVGVAVATHADGSPVTMAKAAEPGETVTFTATGLGSAPTLRVLFDGQPGEVSSTGAVEGQPGRYLIRVVVPRGLALATGAAAREVPVALATPESFTDLADLLVIRRQ